MAINNPYVPGDPACYDLKWMVQEINAAKAVREQAEGSAAAAAASAEAAAASAERAGDWEADARLYAQNAETSANNAASSAEDAAGVVAPVTQALNTQGQQISVLEGRMDTFASLAEGSTTGDAELQDIRVAADGTTYPTAGDAVRGQVNKLQDEIEEVNGLVGIFTPEFTPITGSFISAQGSISQNALFDYSDPIPVEKGDKIILVARGYLTNVAMISTVNETGSNISVKVVSISSNTETYEYTATENGYIAISYRNAVTPQITIIRDKIEALNDRIDEVATTTQTTPNVNSGFIHRDGRIMEGANFRYSDPIRVENGILKFNARGYSNVVSLLCSCDENGEHRNNIINSSDNSTVAIAYAVAGVQYFIISSSAAVPIEYEIIKSAFPIPEAYTSPSLFNTFGVIGDSFASGALLYNNTHKDDYAHSWGQILARKLGTICTNYSRSGLTTRSWLTDTRGLPLLLNSPAEEIYYLVLGINDASSLGESYLGSLEDITSHSSMADYGDTFYGNYGRIIENIQQHAPHAKIVMFTMAHETTNAIPYNTAIIEIAKHYGIPYIVQTNDSFFTSQFFWDNLAQGHPRAVGYSGMAAAFERLLTDCLRNNTAYFFDAFCY